MPPNKQGQAAAVLERQVASATGLFAYDESGFRMYDFDDCTWMTAKEILDEDNLGEINFLCNKDVERLNLIQGVVTVPGSQPHPSEGAISADELTNGQEVVVTSGDPVRFRARYRERCDYYGVAVLVFELLDDDGTIIHVFEEQTKLDRPD